MLSSVKITAFALLFALNLGLLALPTLATVTGTATSGNDIITGDDGNNPSLRGGDGMDTITGGNGNDYLYGDNGTDTLSGDNGNDYLYGGDGDDILSGGSSNDYLYGGNGDDIYIVSAGEGSDTINDIASVSTGDTLKILNLTTSGVTQDPKFSRPAGTNSLRITIGNQIITVQQYFTTAGLVERIKLFRGVDGSEQIGNDWDTATVNKLLSTGSGTTTATTGTFAATLALDPASTTAPYTVNVHFNEGVTINTSNVKSIVKVLGGIVSSTDIVGSGQDWKLKVSFDKTTTTRILLQVPAGRIAATTDSGHKNLDSNTLVIEKTVGGGVSTTGNGQIGSQTTNELTGGDGNDTLRGKKGDDILRGNGGNDDMGGGEGNDSLYGGAGDDRMAGWLGNDKIYGEEGNDTLQGGPGADELFGGNGDDKYNLWREGRNDTITDDSGSDTLNLVGRTLDDITLSQPAGTNDLLIVTISAPRPQVTIKNYFLNGTATVAGANAVETINFYNRKTVFVEDNMTTLPTPIGTLTYAQVYARVKGELTATLTAAGSGVTRTITVTFSDQIAKNSFQAADIAVTNGWVASSLKSSTGPSGTTWTFNVNFDSTVAVGSTMTVSLPAGVVQALNSNTRQNTATSLPVTR